MRTITTAILMLLSGHLFSQQGSLQTRINTASDNIEEKVIITGHLEEISDIYSIIDIFVSTSLWEGLPYVILEAMWFKKPIIASDLGYEGVVYNNENGILVKLGDHHILAKTIINLLKDKALIKEMGEKGHLLINTHFRFESFIKQHEQLYMGIAHQDTFKIQ